MELLSVSEYEKRICDLQKELQVIFSDIEQADKDAVQLVEERVQLTSEQIRAGARQVINQKRNEIISRTEDLSLIEESLKTEILQMEKQKNIVLLLESLTPEVEKYKVARGAYLSTFEKIQDKVNKYHKLGSEIKGLVTEFHLCQQVHPINLLLSVSIKADEVGLDYSSLVNDGVPCSELGKYTLLQPNVQLSEIQETIKSLENFTQTICLNEFYVKPFYREREEPVLQEGKISTGMQCTTSTVHHRTFSGPNPVMRGDNHDQQVAAA